MVIALDALTRPASDAALMRPEAGSWPKHPRLPRDPKQSPSLLCLSRLVMINTLTDFLQCVKTTLNAHFDFVCLLFDLKFCVLLIYALHLE